MLETFAAVLKLARVEGNVTWRFERVNATNILRELVDFYEPAAEDVQRTGEKVDGHAHVTFLHAAHGGKGCPHALGQRSLRDMAAPACQRNVAAELVDGALDRQGNRGFHANRSQGILNVGYRVLSGRLYQSAPEHCNKCSQWNI